MFSSVRLKRLFFSWKSRGCSTSVETLPIQNSQSRLLPITAAIVPFLTLAAWELQHERQNSSKCCGIMAYVGNKPSLEYLLEGLTILQNRGYDSAGVSTLDSITNAVKVTKYASVGSTSDSIELLKDHSKVQHANDVVGIAHTRWATHGAKTDNNAHPHTDNGDRLSLVHNGTIENASLLKKQLQAEGYTFTSETDTEVIVQMIGYYIDKGCTYMEAIRMALGRMEGTWGLAILHRDFPDQIVCACNGSPIVVGIGQDCMFIASEHSAFQRHTNEYIALKDGEVAVVHSSGVSLDHSRIEKAPEQDIQLSPEPWPHWTIKEIMEQPAAVSRSLGYGSRITVSGEIKLGGLEQKREWLKNIRHLVLSACGTSLHSLEYGCALMKWLGAFDTCQTTDAAELCEEDFAQHNAGLFVASQSGETKDVVRALEIAESKGIPRFSIVNCVGSLIARMTGCGVYLYAGREHAVASTKAFVTQVAAVSLVAAWFSQMREARNSIRMASLLDALHRLPTYIGMTLGVREHCQALAESIKNEGNLFVLGRGFSYPIAREGALKIKEITYIHAEGYSGGALKHGPFALLEEGTPVIMVMPDDHHAKHMVTCCHEISCRGGRIIAITDNPKLLDGIHPPCDIIRIPSNGPLTALLGVIPLQLLAYELAVARGINPDNPRHLAKAVTVY